VRLFGLRPPHFPAESSSVSSGSAPTEPVDAVCAVLEAVQHYMGRASGRSWPGDGLLPDHAREDGRPSIMDADGSRAWFDAFPQPHAVVEGDSLRAWYGDEAAPTLDLGRLPLS
jgi:hypothetical protein